MFCVLNWGIGHASRSIPIIRMLLKYGQMVYLASDGDALAFLRREFPELEYCELPAYNPIYPRGDHGMIGKIALQMPKFRRTVQAEHAIVERIVKEKRIDIVISDNRYGCYSHRVKSVLISHQVNILMPRMYGFMEPFVNYMNQQQIKKFYRLWVPDYKDDRNLTGDLSFSSTIGRRYIGHLTRMEPMPDVTKIYDVMSLVSGPEPQREIFEQLMRKQLSSYKGKSLLVCGKPTGTSEIKTNGRYSEVDFLDTTDLNLAIEQSKIIIARSGYSTIMDLAKLGKDAIFVPTPGQTEQEYLASVLMQRGITYTKSQNEFKLEKCLNKTKLYTGFKALNFENDALEDVIYKMLK